MKRKPRPKRRIQAPDPAFKRYFAGSKEPSYKKWEVLAHFISDRGKMLPRSRTGLDAKTQRKLSREIKRARHLALLPFVVKPL